jgi:hypothetical protein
MDGGIFREGKPSLYPSREGISGRVSPPYTPPARGLQGELVLPIPLPRGDFREGEPCLALVDSIKSGLL